MLFLGRFSMPPVAAQLSGAAHIKHSEALCGYLNTARISSLLLLATLFWSIKSYLSRRKRIMSQTASPSGKGSLDPTPHSSLDTKPTPQPSDQWEKEHRMRLDSLGEELQQESADPTPIHPWILPPQALPGPYDPAFYPLPMPTIRRDSSDAQSPPPGDAGSPPPEESRTVSYVRRTARTGSPPRDMTLHSTTTASTQGWRRTQWVVTGG